MITAVDLERQAVYLRVNSNLGSSDTWDFMARVGGDIAVTYGMLRMIPERHKWRHRSELLKAETP